MSDGCDLGSSDGSKLDTLDRELDTLDRELDTLDGRKLDKTVGNLLGVELSCNDGLDKLGPCSAGTRARWTRLGNQPLWRPTRHPRRCP